MVSVICRDGKFLVKGSFFMGNAGTFENKEYGEGSISIETEFEDISTNLEKDYFWMKPLKILLENPPENEDAMAKIYEDYLNGMEKKIKKNVKNINNYFWYQLISHLYDCEYPFWEVEEAILPQYRGKCSDAEDKFQDVYGSDSLYKDITALCKEYNDVSLETNVDKSDVETLIKRELPMFDLDALAAAIKPDCLCIDGGMLHVQFSDQWNCSFFCSAYVEFDDTLTPSGWDNF